MDLADLDAYLDDPRWDDIASGGPAESSPKPHSLAGPDEEGPRGQPRRLRATPPRLGRPRKHWDREAALDLWLEPVPGYKRDDHGRWRYERTGLPVPGARDITLGTLYNFPVDDGVLLVPVDLAKGADELAWCLKAAVGERPVVMDDRATLVLEVPLGEWAVRCHAPLGLDAPELAPSRLIDLAGVARLAGISYNTALSYFYRRRDVPLGHRFPEPVARVAGRPVWSLPLIRSWLAARPGQGARGPKPQSDARHQATRGGALRERRAGETSLPGGPP
jgi:hypothetical protein